MGIGVGTDESSPTGRIGAVSDSEDVAGWESRGFDLM